jgi:homocysteine S-methyltransferase
MHTTAPTQTMSTTTTSARAALDATGSTLITDAGLETWLIFHHGHDLPAFAAYPLAGTEPGRDLLEQYYLRYVEIATAIDAGVLLEAPTWRANPEWAATIGHDVDDLGRLIAGGIELLHDLRDRHAGQRPFLVSGTVGPRGDGYELGRTMTAEEASGYHDWQIARMAESGVDLVSALTMGYVEEAIGIATAARRHDVPVVISFTLETDGRLPSGTTLGDAIESTDAATGGYPLHYMINCAHPTHFDHALEPGASWAERIGGLRANASTLSHAELDEMVELDEGDRHDLAERYVGLRPLLPALRVLGGCCGTDDSHVEAIARAWAGRR